jgi:hypothetical protein
MSHKPPWRPMLRPASRQRLGLVVAGLLAGLAAWEAVSLACQWIAAARAEQQARYSEQAHMAWEVWTVVQAMGREYRSAHDFARALDVSR